MDNNSNIKLYVAYKDTVEEIYIDKDSSIKDLKLIIESKTNIPSKNQILFYKKSLLENEDTLDEYNISNNKMIELKIKKGSRKRSNNERNLNIQRRNNDNIENKNSEVDYLGLGSDILKTISNALNSPNEVHKLLQSPIIDELKDNNDELKKLNDYVVLKNFYDNNNVKQLTKIVNFGSTIVSLLAGRNYNKNINDNIKNNNILNKEQNNYSSSDEEEDDIRYNTKYKKNNKKNNIKYNENYNNSYSDNESDNENDNENNYKKKYKKHLKQLHDMGFDDDNINISLLVKFNGDIEKCINNLYE